MSDSTPNPETRAGLSHSLREGHYPAMDLPDRVHALMGGISGPDVKYGQLAYTLEGVGEVTSELTHTTSEGLDTTSLRIVVPDTDGSPGRSITISHHTGILHGKKLTAGGNVVIARSWVQPDGEAESRYFTRLTAFRYTEGNNSPGVITGFSSYDGLDDDIEMVGQVLKERANTDSDPTE